MSSGSCNAEPHPQPLCCCVNTGYTNWSWTLQCWSTCMHTLSHGLRCLCQGQGTLNTYTLLHQVTSSGSVHSPVQEFSPESRSMAFQSGQKLSTIFMVKTRSNFMVKTHSNFMFKTRFYGQNFYFFHPMTKFHAQNLFHPNDKISCSKPSKPIPLQPQNFMLKTYSIPMAKCSTPFHSSRISDTRDQSHLPALSSLVPRLFFARGGEK